MVLPYFGKLPSYWGGAFDSFQECDYLDFLIITDCEIDSSSSNIRIIKMSWKEMQDLVKSKYKSLGYNRVCISHPYKLCDYKPTYGYLFEEYLQGYDYWGYMDCDLVLGDVKKYLEEIDITKYDRVFPYGHFSLYRNTTIINHLFTSQIKGVLSFNDVVSTTYARHFDEAAMNEIFKKEELDFYDHPVDASMGIWAKEFKWKNQDHPELGELFVKETDGSTAVYSMTKEGSITRTEVMYIHFLSKKNISIPRGFKKPYCIMRSGVFHISESEIPEYLTKSIYTKEDQLKFHDELRKANAIQSRKRLIREIKYNKFRALLPSLKRVGAWIEHKNIAKKYKGKIQHLNK